MMLTATALSRLQGYLLPLIVLIAFALRLWGITFGLPNEYHVDEVQYVRQAVSMGERGLAPVWWNNPPFYKYVYLVEYGVLYVLGRAVGWYASIADFAAQNGLDPSSLYLLGRATTALLGALTVLAVYLVGKAAYSKRVGLLAAWFLAVCFLHVRDSHYAVNDVPAAFFVTWSLLGAIRIVDTQALKWYIFTGAAIGLGFATKYTAILAVFPALIAHLLASNVRATPVFPRHLGRLALLSLAAIAAAILASPYFVIVPDRVFHDVYEALYLPGVAGFEGWLIDPAGGFVYYAKSLVWGCGWGLLLLCGLGLLVAALRGSSKDWVLLSFAVLTIVFLGRQSMYFARFVLLMIPVLMLLAAAALDSCCAKLFLTRRDSAQFGWAAVAFLVSVQPFASSLRSNYLLSQTDVRDIAKQWIEMHIPEGTKIAMDWQTYGPALSQPDQLRPHSSRIYDVTAVMGKGLSEHPITWYQEQGYDYLIASSFIYDLSLVDPGWDAARRDFYASLNQQTTLVREFRPYHPDAQPLFVFDELYGPAVSLWQRERPGPVLRIYKIDSR
jgi:4-amino-4-deoxy-L-arabinose transferase-like glycosyltransferase